MDKTQEDGVLWCSPRRTTSYIASCTVTIGILDFFFGLILPPNPLVAMRSTPPFSAETFDYRILLAPTSWVLVPASGVLD